MKIAILGAGNVGGALATALARKGHAIFLGVRDPAASKYQEMAKALGQAAASGIERPRPAEAVVPATPWSAAQSVIEHAGALEGRSFSTR
jgi:predicted dinucleotide-binding enzyme